MNSRDGTVVDVVMKLSAGSEIGVSALIAEALASFLAADLDLPVPEPYIVHMSPEFISSISSDQDQQKAAASNRIAFGSRLIQSGFRTWPTDKRSTKIPGQVLAEIFAFDALIENPDRRREKPNCLVQGDQIAIIDHEAAFPLLLIFNRKNPWEAGAMRYMTTGQDQHLFYNLLKRRKSPDFSRFSQAWKGIDDQRFSEYLSAIPAEWNEKINDAHKIISAMKAVRDNMNLCVEELNRVLGIA